VSSLTVVVSTFNEADNVDALVTQLAGELRDIDAEILFANDSTDHTPETIRNAAAEAALPVRVLHREVPQGRLAGAVVAGLEAPDSPWVVVMDGDLQHPPGGGAGSLPPGPAQWQRRGGSEPLYQRR